jgi:hypothetical protein
MRAVDLLREQLNGCRLYYHALADDLTDAEWTGRAVPESNVPGYTLWHLPRTLDWSVQTAARGVPEVIAREPWTGRRLLAEAGIGVEIPLAEADAIAAAVAREDVIAYADAVLETVRDWLSTLGDDDLDATPDVVTHHEHVPFAAYRRPEVRREVAGMAGSPVWALVYSPGIEHYRDHLGELDLIKQILRRGAGTN